MCLIQAKGFQVRVREGISLGSIVVISCDSTDWWVLSAQGLGSRSWTLVTLIVCCLWNTNCWSILWLLYFPVFVDQGSQFLMICRISWAETVTRPDESLPAEDAPEWVHCPYKDIWEVEIGEYLRGVPEGFVPWKFPVTTHQYLSWISWLSSTLLSGA